MPHTNINRNIQNQPLDQQLVLAPFFASKIGYYFVANMLERNKNKESHADTAASILENITNCISQSQIVIV